MPVPHIAMKAVAVTAADGRSSLQAPTVRASIEWLPLLAGRIAYGDIRVDGARIVVDPAATSPSTLATVAGTLTALADFPVRLSMNDATLSVVRQGVTVHALTGLNTTTRRRDGQGRTPVLTKFRYGSREVVLDALAPASTPKGRSQLPGLRLDARTNGFALKATLPSEAQPVGDIALNVTNVAQTLAWLGLSSPLANVFNRIDLQGRLTQQAASWDIDGARLSVDGQMLEGALSWNTTRDKPVFAGTLAGSSLDLGQLVTRLAGARLDRPDITEWGFDPAEGHAASQAANGRMHDLDLRLSLEKASIGTLNLEEAPLRSCSAPPASISTSCRPGC